MLPRFAYVRADSERRALDELREEGAHLHAGGTDLLGCLHDGVFDATKVVSISGLEGLRGIVETAEGGLHIGALTTLAEVARAAVVVERYPGLAQAAGEVASPQLRNQGTLGGNLCQRPRCWYFRGEFDCAKKGGDACFAVNGENRYHAIFGGGPCYIVHPSDTAPALVALGAEIHLSGPGGKRRMRLEGFFQLPEENLEGENVLGAGEMVTGITVPPAGDGLVSSYRKVRERGSWDFALTSLALALRLEGLKNQAGRLVKEASLVLGGVAPVPWRSTAAERLLVGKQLNPVSARAAAEAAAQGAEPLERNGYKELLVRGVVEEALLAII